VVRWRKGMGAKRASVVAGVIAWCVACSFVGPSPSDLQTDLGKPIDGGHDGAGAGDAAGDGGGDSRCDGPCPAKVVISSQSELGSIVARGGQLAWTSRSVLYSCRADDCQATARTIGAENGLTIRSRLTLFENADRIGSGAMTSATMGVGHEIGFDGKGEDQFGFISDRIDAVAASADTAYVALRDTNEIRFCDRSCNRYIGEWNTLVAGTTPVVAMALGPSKLYWLRGGAPGAVLSCGRQGCTPNAVASVEVAGLDDPQGLAVYANGFAVTVHGDGRVLRCGLGGCAGTPGTVANQTAATTAPYGIAATVESLVWANEGQSTVMECPLEGCSTPTVIASVDRPRFVAVDGTEIFVTSPSTGTIYRIVR